MLIILIIFPACAEEAKKVAVGGQSENFYREVESHFIHLAKDEINLIEGEISSLDSPLSQEAKGLLIKNAESIELFKKATSIESDGFIFGIKPENFHPDSPLPKLSSYLGLFRLVLLEYKQAILEGKVEDAQKLILVNIRFLQQLSKQRSYSLLSSIIKTMAWTSIKPVISSIFEEKEFNNEFYHQLLNGLIVINDSQIPLSEILKEERNDEFGVIKMLEEEKRKEWEGNPPTSLKYWRQVLDIYKAETETFQQLSLEAAKENDPRKYVSAQSALKQRLEKEIASREPFDKITTLFRGYGWGASPEIFAKKIILLVLPRLSGFFDTYYAVLADINNFTMAFSIKCFYLDHAQYPESVEELKPEYISELPKDPFNDFHPINFVMDESKIMIYSLGPDRVDQDGFKIINMKDITEQKGEFNIPEGDIVFVLNKK